MSEQTSAPVSILIVEDSVTQAMVLENLLQRRGFVAASVRNGRFALAWLRENRADLVISDINMPEINGYDLCLRLKQDAELKDVPIMLLTQLSAPQDIIRGLECGADNFVVKPYEEEFLLSRIHAVLENQALRKGGVEETAIPIYFAGEKYLITANRLQILNLLLSTYETAVKTNRDLVRAHEELKAAQDQLIEAEKFQSVGRLAAGVAHEVKNPLAIMEMGLGFLSESIGEGDSAAILAEMKEAVRRANTVIAGLMDYSASNDSSHADSADVHTVIDRALDSVATELREARVIVMKDFGKDLPRCPLFTQRMTQVFANIFTNACHAMPNGGVLTIHTAVKTLSLPDVTFHAGDRSGERARVGDHAIIVEVLDTGPGIARENLSKLFEPFFSTKPTGKGTGLGLTVARKIVELHGGRIDIHNRPEGGAQVTLLLPCRDTVDHSKAVLS